MIDFKHGPHKQAKYLPGTGIPLLGPEDILRARPNYVMILPWNLQAEVAQMHGVAAWGGRFIVQSPTPRVLP